MIIKPYSALDELENTEANFPFLANSYYWPCDETDGTVLAEATGGQSYDPVAALGFSTNGVTIGSNTATTVSLSRIGLNDNLLIWIAGKPDFNTSNAGIVLGGSNIDGISIEQNATQTLFNINDSENTGATLSATVANAELKDQVCAIMVKNSTGADGGTITADYYIVAEDESAISTGSLTPTGTMNGGLPTTVKTSMTISRYTSGSGVLRGFGIVKLSETPTATQIKAFLGWMSWQIKTNQKRGLYPGWKGRS